MSGSGVRRRHADGHKRGELLRRVNAQQALRLLRRLGAVSRQDARQMRSLLGREVAVPDSLLPVDGGHAEKLPGREEE